MYYKVIAVLLALTMVMGLAGCGQGAVTNSSLPAESEVSSEAVSEAEPSSQETSAESAEELEEDTSIDESELEQIPDEFMPLSDPGSGVAVPSSRMGKYIQVTNTIYATGGSQIDYGNAAEGYVRVAQSGSTKRLKVQIVHPNKTYNYDLNTNGTFEVFPLQSGNGTYKIRIMQNVEGNKYTQLAAKEINVTLNDQLSPFLYPSQYVNYNADSQVVKKAAELCNGITGDVEKVAAVYSWIINNVTYDQQKAATVQTGYLPLPDNTLSTKTGICFDYAALMAAMLRSQGVPTRLICGTVSAQDLNHAWNEVYLEGKGWVTVKIYFEGNTWQRMDPTFGASGNANIEQYIGDGSNYTSLRVY